jgi:hypothetical protein
VWIQLIFSVALYDIMLIAYYPARIVVQLPEAEGEGCKMQIVVMVVLVSGIIVQTAEY